MDTLSTTTHQISSLIPKSSVSNATNNNAKLLIKPASSNPYPPLSTNNSPVVNTKTKHKHFNPTSALHQERNDNSALAASGSTVQTERKAATGYAAALLNAACSDVNNYGGMLAAIVKDAMIVKRIVNMVLTDGRVKEEEKGKVVRKAVERGELYAKLVVMVRMLVVKGRVKAVEEVMDEFVRLWEELCGIERLVFVREKTGSSGFVVVA